MDPLSVHDTSNTTFCRALRKPIAFPVVLFLTLENPYQIFPDIFHAASGRLVMITNGRNSPCGDVKIFGIGGNNIGGLISIQRIVGYHGCAGHTGVMIRRYAWSFLTRRQNGGNAYAFIEFHLTLNAYIAMAPGSGFQLIY